ncbi:Secreted protein, containing von Willebrand factor (VWF) type A domain [Methylophaga thiooxydans]|uniref:Secreted protein, containing von Willebrand factor (VWF) type A domain n=1 Tax=Methylophaga thiooxydans TaxID=392484 RepID=A0A0A0BJV2_9GAMM|nr:hypothetical protein [Methylophaga thiooxydans]KGM07967.1 Secreted protein, containing von Willebrand factor (VWF) type A domain [Methylophaga thiooxydans]
MKRRHKSLDIFSLSFLDVISCGFGAVVMLILIAKTDVESSVAGADEVSALLASLISLQNSVTEIQQEMDADLNTLQQLSSQKQSVAQASQALENQRQSLEQKNASIAERISGLSLVEERLKQASLSTPQRPNSERDIEVGGIPVDSDYVVFIVDTSGSMKSIWGSVSKEVINVLNIHPEVKGFQILNDMGKPLISGYDGKWIPDTASRRQSVIALFKKWNALSNSSPVEGLTVALRKYAKPNITTSIYVFGDEYSGGGYDAVINTVAKENRTLSSGRKLAKIHAVGFISAGTTDRFSVLMREITQQNDGTFIALPR